MRHARMDRVRERMDELGVDALLLSHGADLPWLTGYRAMPLERLTMLVLRPDGEPVLVVPALEAPRVAGADDLFSMLPWTDDRGPDRTGGLAADRWAAGRRPPASPGRVRPGLGHHGAVPPTPPPRRRVDRSLHRHLPHPGRQGCLRARGAAGRGRGRRSGGGPTAGRRDRAHRADRGGGVRRDRRPPGRGRPSAGQFRHRRQRAQRGQPPSRARRPDHRAR